MAQVKGVQFLKTGKFASKLVVYDDADQLRGFLDVESTVANTGKVDAPSYFFEGTRSGDQVSLRFTDRTCGAGTPTGLCVPLDPVFNVRTRFIYEAKGTMTGSQLTLTKATVIVGTAALSVPFEPPFEALTAQRSEPASSASGTDVVGHWKGHCELPRDSVYALPVAMTGMDEMYIARAASGMPATMTKFIQAGKQVFPAVADDPILLGDTFKFADDTKNFWFVSVWNEFSRWVYLGRLEGDALKIQIIGDDLSGPDAVWAANRAPVDPMTADFVRNLEGACYFTRVE